jgi:hypothetical protein
MNSLGKSLFGKTRFGKTLLGKTIVAALLCCSSVAFAGRSCQPAVPSAQAQEQAAIAANKVQQALEQSGKDIAIIARIGQDLSEHGLVYSHAAFVLKKDESWTVIHLLNQCGTDNGGIFTEGLQGFFLDTPLRYQSKLVFLDDQLGQKISAALQQHQGNAVFESRYSVIARPGSTKRQNSTAWLLENIAAASGNLQDSREEARLVLKQMRYAPDRIHIPYSQRIAGGLFSANAVFTDHPLSTRLSGDYPVTTVRSIFRFLRQQSWLQNGWWLRSPKF